MINSIEISETGHEGIVTAHRHEGAREEHILLEQGELGSLARTTLVNINKKWEGQSCQDGKNCKTFGILDDMVVIPYIEWQNPKR